MKRLFFVSGVFFGVIHFNTYAQNVGINTTGALPNPVAGLDVDFTNKGILIPRVALSARNSNLPIGGGIVNSLLVYNTATAGTFPNNVYPGYYYWDGTAWQRLVNGIANGWNIDGNTLTGALPATPNEFIGTLNAADWIIKTNNTERMRVKSNGQVVVNNTTPFAGDVFSAYASGTDAAINGYSSGSGEAVYAQNTNPTGGNAIVGITTNTSAAVYGQGPTNGVLGFATGANATGVVGIGTPTNTADGVYGAAGENTSFGVWAVHINTITPNGTGLAVAGNGVITNYLSGGSGIAASGSTFAIIAFGKTASDGNGISASGNNLSSIISYTSGSGGTFQGQTIGVYGHAANSGNSTFGGYFDNGSSIGYAYVGGTDAGGTVRKIIGGGTVSTIIRDIKGNLVSMNCPEAPEILFEDYGVGQLINGKAHIDLDPVFAKNVTINEKHPLRVFIQLEGECNGVYVTNKTKNGFDVIELNNGKSNVSFVYHVIANRADEYDEEGRLLSKNADIRFSPAPPKQIPVQIESKTKEIPVINIPVHSVKQGTK